MFYFDWTYLLIIPGMLLGLWAQYQVKHAYAEYSRIPTRLSRSAANVVDELLRRNGNHKVRIGRVNGGSNAAYAGYIGGQLCAAGGWPQGTAGE